MRKQLTLLVVAVAFSLAFSGLVMAEDITVVGTGSGMPLLKAVGKAFTQKNPGVNIIVPGSIGSSGGIKTVGTEKYKIGRIARNIKDTEKHYGLTALPFAKMPIVFFVNKSVGLKDLTPSQVCDIYSDKIGDWGNIGGKDGRVRVVRREDGDSSLKVLLKSFPGFKDITLTSKSKTTFTDQETIMLAEKKAGIIAWGDYANARNYKVDILSISGKAPTDDDYPYNGTLSLIFKEKNRTGDIAKFVEFVTSAPAQEAIRAAGGLPVAQ